MPLVFVYGTLMRDGCRHSVLQAEQFVECARTAPRYRLHDCGSYPGLVECRTGVAVEGEIWNVSGECLARLDNIEGVPEGLYERRPISLADRAWPEPVEAYFYLQDVSRLPDVGSRWRNHPG